MRGIHALGFDGYIVYNIDFDLVPADNGVVLVTDANASFVIDGAATGNAEGPGARSATGPMIT